jgi:hypothetical protein
MKKKLLSALFAASLLLMSSMSYAQAPDLGSVSSFVMFSSDGAVTNTGISQFTGNVGTNNGSSTGFGNVNGIMHDGDAASILCSTDLLLVYNEILATTPGFFAAPLLGNGQTLTAGVYYIDAAATLDNELILDAENDADAIFIFHIAGSFSTSANSSVSLINDAQACNVFWVTEGLIEMASNTKMKGTVIADNSGININTGCEVEGRVLSTTGAINTDGVLLFTPIGCGSPFLTGPIAPYLGEAACYGIFSADGPVVNVGISSVVGHVGANVGLTIGYDPLLVTGHIHENPDASTAQAAADLLLAYNYLNGLPFDIELLYPAQFGGQLVLTPHTYVLNGATTLTDTLFLNAQGNPDAVFVIKIYGALNTITNSQVELLNEALPQNVYWVVNGAVDIADNSVFNGSIIAQGALNLYTGTIINGRVLTGIGAIGTSSIISNSDISPDCHITNIETKLNSSSDVVIYPNPFNNFITIDIKDASKNNFYEVKIFNNIGQEIVVTNIIQKSQTIDTQNLPSGIYFYVISNSKKIIKSGKITSTK